LLGFFLASRDDECKPARAIDAMGHRFMDGLFRSPI
jgi:hypothetical protein